MVGLEFDMEELKRIRTANWSEQEKKLLRTLVLERADIIEKKDATTNTNAAKKLAWEEVLSSFNTVSVNKRSMTQLLNQWRNMKNNAKKSEFKYRRARTMTGGGPPLPRNKSDCCSESHEHQLFILAKTAREEALIRETEAHECKMRHERELHERRLTLMHLEEDYWKAKILNLK